MSNLKLPVFAVLVASALGIPHDLRAEPTLSAKVQSRLTATWQGQELGTVLRRIADSQHISLWIDRRVDPQPIVNAQFNDAELPAVFDQVLGNTNAGWSTWDEIVYIGPRESAREMATLMAIARGSLDKLSAPRRSVWMATDSMSWPRLSDPREVLADLMDRAGIKIKNPEVLSHDLWDAAQLPPLPLVDRVVLLLLGYDKTCLISPSGQTLEIVPIHRPVVVTYEYEPGRQMRDLLSAFGDDSAVVLDRRGNRVAITGRWEDQQRARQIIAGSTRSRGNVARTGPRRVQEQRFSLKLENQRVDRVIEQLAGQIGLAVNWKGLTSRQRERLTSCEIQDGTLEELLEAVLAPAGLRYSLEGKELTILSR